MQTIMITGCSSGFGLETARYFLEQGWKVIATMRAPQTRFGENASSEERRGGEECRSRWSP